MPNNPCPICNRPYVRREYSLRHVIRQHPDQYWDSVVEMVRTMQRDTDPELERIIQEGLAEMGVSHVND